MELRTGYCTSARLPGESVRSTKAGGVFSSKPYCWCKDPRLEVVLMLRSSFRLPLLVGCTLAAPELKCKGDCFLSLETDDACLLTARGNIIALMNDLGDRNALVGERRQEAGGQKGIKGRCWEDGGTTIDNRRYERKESAVAVVIASVKEKGK